MKSKAQQTLQRAFVVALLIVFLGTTGASALTLYKTLEFGDSGSDVLRLQQSLTTLGFDPGGTDGRFGRGTENAVKAYQKSAGLTVDGKAGSLTLNALYQAADNTSTTYATATNSSTLQYGDSGERVRLLQTALKDLGYTIGTVDGKFGLLTRTAVIAFQRSKKITADGLAGTKTLELLYSSAGSDTPSPTAAPTQSPSLSASLRKGGRGSEVLAIQKKLKELGYYTGKLDSDFGSGTLAAVISFQRKNDLTKDGIVGAGTYGVLFSGSAVAAGGSSTAPDATTAPSTGSLRQGDTGAAVKTMQQALKDLKYNVSADGDFGANTKAAVVAFQRKNKLTADGIAGSKTLEKLYSGSAVPYTGSSATATPTQGPTVTPKPTTIPSTALTDTTSTSASSGLSSSEYGSISGPGGVTVRPLYWYTEVKPKLSTGDTMTVYDPASKLTWKLRVYSRGRHCDAEPLTAEDTATMYEAFGSITWTPKPVYVKLPDGRWTLATTHDVAHLSGALKDNDFDGHLCVHFLRTYPETKVLDPNYGVTNQNAIRSFWKSKAGVTIP